MSLNQTPDAAILTMLIPGSVWEREGREGPVQVTVLAITNDSLSARRLEQFPRQVVFVSERGNILSQEVDQFLSRRTYVSLNTNVEALMSTVLDAALEAENAEEINFDEVTPITEGAENIVDGQLELAEKDSSIVSPFNHEGAPILSELFTQYEVSYSANVGTHRLKFLLDGMTLEKLASYFDGSTGFRIGYQVGDTLEEVEMTAGSWSLYPATLEIRAAGTAYGVITLVTDEVQEETSAVVTPVVEAQVAQAEVVTPPADAAVVSPVTVTVTA